MESVSEFSIRAVQLYSKWIRADGVISVRGNQQQLNRCDGLDLRAASRFVDRFRRFSEGEAGRVRGLLEESDDLLRPLADPLRFAFLEHRWFDPCHVREESYSDWLAWLLRSCNSMASIGRILGLDGHALCNLVDGRIDRIAREEQARVEGADKRLDIVCWAGEHPVVIVEVKIGSIDFVGGRENLPIYAKWQSYQHTCRNKSDRNLQQKIIIVPDETEDLPCEWKVRTWRDICISLRLEARLTAAQTGEGLLLGAILLTFAGAVEQNILGLEGTGSRGSAAATASHLESWIKEARNGLAQIC